MRPVPTAPRYSGNVSGSNRGRLLTAERDGYRFQWKNDGTDYPKLLEDFKAGRLTTVQISDAYLERKVYRAEADGRRFVIKWHRWTEYRLKNIVRNFLLYGSYYGRMIRLINRVVSRGCRVVQDVYLVAEKKENLWTRDIYLIAQYVEGQPLLTLEGDNLSAMGDTLAELHDWGLASNDVHPGNFIATGQGLVVIDTSIDRALLRCQANDVLQMRVCYGFKMPVRSRRRKILYSLLFLRYSFRRLLRRLRGCKP